MAGNLLGAKKRAAAVAGCSLEVYEARLAAGEKRCWRCETWRHTSEFDADRSRGDGIAAECRPCRRVPENAASPRRQLRRRLQREREDAEIESILKLWNESFGDNRIDEPSANALRGYLQQLSVFDILELVERVAGKWESGQLASSGVVRYFFGALKGKARDAEEGG